MSPAFDGSPPADLPPAGALLDDATLVHRVRAGDERAYETLFRAHAPLLGEFARTFVHDASVAREVVADVFVRLWERRAEWTVPVSVRAYLYTAVANAARNVLRSDTREARRRERSVDPDADGPPWMGVPGAAPDQLAEHRDTSAHIWRAVNALPEADRTVLILRWRYELSYDEIAGILGATSAAVQRRQSRALARLRDTLPTLFGDPR